MPDNCAACSCWAKVTGDVGVAAMSLEKFVCLCPLLEVKFTKGKVFQTTNCKDVRFNRFH